MALANVHPYFHSHVPAGRVAEIVVPHPERTAFKNCTDGCGYIYQSWANRPAMLKSIQIQASGPTNNPWRAVQRGDDWQTRQ